MPQIGPLEILVVAVLALITLGPEKLPSMARKAGQGITQLKAMANQAKAEFQDALDDDDLPEDSEVVAGAHSAPS